MKILKQGKYLKIDTYNNYLLFKYLIMNQYNLLKKREIMALYRTCLYLTKEIGFKPGDTRNNTYKPINYHKLKYKEKKKILNNLKKEDLGAFVAFNIRKMFKDNLDLKEKIIIDQSINYGYHFIRNMPIYLYPYCIEYLKDLHLYEK